MSGTPPESHGAGPGDPPRSRVDVLRTRLLETLDRVVDPGRPLVLAEFPAYGNVGDSAIHLGQLRALRALGRPVPRYVVDSRVRRLGEIRRALRDDAVLLLSGGGSFGDVWPDLHRRRLRLLEAFPDVPVIQLPQTLHFRDPDALAATGAALQSHGSVRLLVRDSPSLRTAREELGVEAELCPDAALALGPLPRAAPPREGTVWLLRGDRESRRPAGGPSPGDGVPAPVDWVRQPADPLRLAASALRRLRRVAPLPGTARLARTLHVPLARQRLRRGVALLSRGEVVVTDRLHGHVLALMLGIPHVVLDNSYGKVAAFHRSWTTGVEGVVLASGWEEARERAEALRGR